LTAGTHLVVDRSSDDRGEPTTRNLGRADRMQCERTRIRFSLRLPGQCESQNPAALSARTRRSRSDDAER
jgi:hypothetical protein